MLQDYKNISKIYISYDLVSNMHRSLMAVGMVLIFSLTLVSPDHVMIIGSYPNTHLLYLMHSRLA